MILLKKEYYSEEVDMSKYDGIRKDERNNLIYTIHRDSDKTLQEIAEMFNITRQRVFSILKAERKRGAILPSETKCQLPEER